MKQIFRLTKRRLILLFAALFCAVFMINGANLALYFGFADSFPTSLAAEVLTAVGVAIILLAAGFCLGALIVAFQLTEPKNPVLRKRSLFLCAAVLLLLFLNGRIPSLVQSVYPKQYAGQCIVTETGTEGKEFYIKVENADTLEPLVLYCGETQCRLASRGGRYKTMEYIALPGDESRGRLVSVRP